MWTSYITTLKRKWGAENSTRAIQGNYHVWMIVSIAIISLRELLSNQNAVDYLSDLLQIFNPILHILLGQLIKWLNVCFISLNSWSISLYKPFSMLIIFFFSKRHFKLTISQKSALKSHQKWSCKNNLMPLFFNNDISLWSQRWPNS